MTGVDDNSNGYDNHGFSNDLNHNNGSINARNGDTRWSVNGNPNGEVNEKKAITEKPSLKQKDSRISKTEDVDDEKLDLSCGVWRFRTNFFGTKFSNLYVFALCAGISSLFTHMTGQIMHTQLTSLERQFHINNAMAGLIDTSQKIGFMATILFAGHFAKKVPIPVVVGTAGMLQGLVAVAPALIQFADPYTLPEISTAKVVDNITNTSSFGDNNKYMCDAAITLENGTTGNHKFHTNATEPINKFMFAVIIACQAIKGVTDTFHSGFLTTLYLDDNLLDKSKMGIFLGIKYVVNDLASPIGKEINGILTEVPIDLKDTELDVKDQRFVAAWWLAFLIFGTGTIIFSFPILLFPRKLVTSKQKNDALNKAAVTFAGGQVSEDIVEPITDQLKAEDTVRKSSIIITNVNNELPSESTKTRLYKTTSNISSRRDSLGPGSQPGSRRSSLFPPISGPTERKVSLDGQLAFNQPSKPKQEGKGKQEGKRRGGQDLLVLMKDFPKAVLRVCKKPAFLILLIEGAIVSVPFSGTSLFRSIYMTQEYNVPMSEVAMITGITSAVGHIIGILISGWISSKVHTKTGYVAIICGGVLFGILCSPLYIIFGCGNEHVYGAPGSIGVPVNGSDACDCANAKQLISCGDDGHNYLSPCFAGCTDMDGKLFTECNLLQNNTKGRSVTPGLCDTDCHTNFLIYVLVHGVSSLVHSMSNIPRRLLVLRIVDPQDRGFATALFMFTHSIMGIPSPNLFGGLIDSTCLIWDNDYCSLYDRDKIRYLLTGIDIGSHSIMQFTYIIMFFVFFCETKSMKNKERMKAEEEAAEREREELENKNEENFKSVL